MKRPVLSLPLKNKTKLTQQQPSGTTADEGPASPIPHAVKPRDLHAPSLTDGPQLNQGLAESKTPDGEVR